MNVKEYQIESADFMLNQHTYKGEPITSHAEVNGKLYLFTANHTYICKKRGRLQVWFNRIKKIICPSK